MDDRLMVTFWLTVTKVSVTDGLHFCVLCWYVYGAAETIHDRFG